MPPPRGAALVPLLTVLGSTAAAAVLAQKYVPQYFANMHRKLREQARAEEQQREAEEAAIANKKMAMQTVVQRSKATARAPPVPLVAASTSPPPPRSSEVVAVLLQDPYMLISAFGVCIMVVAVLVSLMLVEFRDDVASLNDLQMFGPLMLVAMGLISLGLVLSTVSPKASPAVPVAHGDEAEEEEEVVEQKTTTSEDAAALKEAAQEGNQGFLYNYYKNKYANEPTTVEVDGEDGQPKKRVSRCPFGFT